MIRNRILAIGVAALTSCGSFVPVVDISRLPIETKHAVQAIKYYDQTQLSGAKFEVLTIVEGNSCQNKTYDPPATRARALEQIKYFAYEVGANGITNLQCGGREGTSVRTNCWELISCTAEAIKIN